MNLKERLEKIKSLQESFEALNNISHKDLMGIDDDELKNILNIYNNVKSTCKLPPPHIIQSKVSQEERRRKRESTKLLSSIFIGDDIINGSLNQSEVSKITYRNSEVLEMGYVVGVDDNGNLNPILNYSKPLRHTEDKVQKEFTTMISNELNEDRLNDMFTEYLDNWGGEYKLKKPHFDRILIKLIEKYPNVGYISSHESIFKIDAKRRIIVHTDPSDTQDKTEKISRIKYGLNKIGSNYQNSILRCCSNKDEAKDFFIPYDGEAKESCDLVNILPAIKMKDTNHVAFSKDLFSKLKVFI